MWFPAVVTAIATFIHDEPLIAATVCALVAIYCGLMLTPKYGSEGG